MSQPLVSIGLPTYNGMPYLIAALQSVLAQDYVNFEVLACDDQSQDGSWAYLAGLNDHRIHAEQNPERQGLVGNWNRCLSRANGQYFVLMHQDDLWLPNNLSAKIALLQANPQVGFVYSNIRQIDGQGVDVGGHWLPASQAPSDQIMPGMTCVRRLLSEGNFICMPGVVIRRELLSAVGFFDDRLPFTVDLEMWLRLASRAAVGYLAQPLVHYRQHSSQETQRFGNGRAVLEFGKAVQYFLTEHMPEARAELEPLAKRNLLSWAARMARWQLRSGNWRAALSYAQAWGQVALGGLPSVA